jgi:flagellar biosynthetic protein FlhB
MALFKDDAGRTEKPTPQRLSEARNKGQVPLSRDLVMAGTLLSAVVVLRHWGGDLVAGLRLAVTRGLSLHDARFRLDDGALPGILRELAHAGWTVAGPVLGLLAALLAAAAAFGYGQIGLRLASQALALRFERLDPAAGLRRILSASAAMRAGLAFLKLIVLLAVPWAVLGGSAGTLFHLHEATSVPRALSVVAAACFDVAFWIAVAILVLAVLDALWQRREHVRNLMMTKQEVEDERKRSEGDPLIKQRLRSAALKLARQRMLEAVPKADVVITNPTHFAVALAYDRLHHAAPTVLAKGADDVAMRIREVARDHGVPLMHDPPLARALWRAVDVGSEIPERFYRAVAAVLSHVYRLRGRTA